MDYSKGEARRWRADDVTEDFFKRVEEKANELDQRVHNLLLARDDQAVILNAQLQMLTEVYMWPDEMINEAEGDD